ncbi:prolipoprotein diacylglyceryl transferase [Streptomyces halobius]|uniref:Phosphatidylglycerol--prolipoprotein diacylglyceryl transferase n=1 Tax=Streptomyces halobius TaxID=2879846 RepID=A0ABY4M060_9ACTN|nr:prolipoprotein diacylglyceryl transferase [Streptomyces halobius]UQA91144.1 prolipoprotein diacylglyceryl transferase [Streptomyces halobius]
MNLAYLPSPPSPYLTVGQLMIHWYAIMVVLGVIAAVTIGQRRWSARGGAAGAVLDVTMFAVPFGILGGRLYHVITSWQLYFGEGRNPVEALYVWQGGLGIWGAIAGGALGAWIAARRRGIDFAAFADALAPGILVGQAIGRFGCWFNQALYGRPTTLPWGLEIDPANRPEATPGAATYHPTFAYEATWNLGAAVFVVGAARRFRLDRGRVFALYVAAYTAGRGWIEMLRVDEANHILGLRLNVWTSLLLFTAAVIFLYLRRPSRLAVLPTAADGTPAPRTAVFPPGSADGPLAVADPGKTATAPAAQDGKTGLLKEPANPAGRGR